MLDKALLLIPASGVFSQCWWYDRSDYLSVFEKS